MSNRLSLLVDFASMLAREVDLDSLLKTACERVCDAVQADRATIWLVDAEERNLVGRVALPQLHALRQPLDRGIAGYVVRTGECVRLADASQDKRFDPSIDRATGYKTKSMLAAPIREERTAPIRGVLQLLNQKSGEFGEEDERYLLALGTQLARALAMTTLRAQDAAEPGLVLRGPFNRIVGRSDALADAYERVHRAAETDATVLLRGETGTGKGLFARAIHVNSPRQAGPFTTVDSTTLPAQLVESELFGHERGAFTGAERRVLGKVELAQGGTLFLDEIGDLPRELQGKLLHFLQERTFERVGGRETITSDVRIVCATHRNLEQAVADGSFRQDLYYRIRVVEIELPTLRARGPAEVLRLTRHFADMYSQRFGRPTSQFSQAALARLQSHSWPGNVRELEHWIESAVVLAADGNIDVQHLPRHATGLVAQAASDEHEITLPLGLSLDAATAKYAQATLAAAEGNKTEAARRLGVSRNTLARLIK
ncbi:MAG: sigma-54-dependent Fis family transcriptional regulator [Sandaracinaceae bacterium]|jgi:DNA-binding NtrC family response regulator|nr:sigma-54-dependent Fis family transcriptional regulator [Sandaracinaceae bacterium]